MSKVWFVTGASRGFGRHFVEAALERGDRVVATARDVASLSELTGRYGDRCMAMALDVTDRSAAFAAVKRAHEHFGRLDVVVNNAGYGHFGMVEEIAEQEIRAQFETNVFGALWVTQAALPLLRAQGSGHIVMLSSVLGVAAFPTTGGYTASKAALEGFAESLAQEVAPFGVKVTIVEPSGFDTGFSTSASRSEAIPAYAPVQEAFMARFASLPQGNASGVGPALLAIVDAETPPLRVFFGSLPMHVVPALYAERLKTWEQWAAVAAQADGGGRG